MSKDMIRYDLLVQEALKGVVRKVVGDAARDGLVGDHHFYISFKTDYPGVRLSNRLREKYPQDMTIVLQHQYWDLGVTEHAFEVGLSFSGVPERLLVPFDALTGFFDPSVQFGLKFEISAQTEEAVETPPSGPRVVDDTDDAPLPAMPKPADAPKPLAKTKPKSSGNAEAPVASDATGDKSKGETKGAEAAKADKASGADVVSLDAFRKKS